MWGGTFNLLYGRDPEAVKKEVIWALSEFNLDYLGVQESTDYFKVLHDIPGYSYYTGGSINGGAATEVGMLVKDCHEVSNIKNRAFGNGWESAKTDARMKPRNFLTLTINGKHKKAVLHMPPSVELAKQNPRDRFEDFRELSLRARAFLSWTSFSKTREIMADWNVPPFVRSRYSPRWIANQTGATLSSPDDGIDYVLTKGLRVVSIKKIRRPRKEKSDHNLVIFETQPRFRRKGKD